MKAGNLPKRVFYHLRDPYDQPHQIYGRPQWEKRFGLASWSEKVGGLSIGRIIRPYGEPRGDLAVVLPSPKVGDFVWTWYHDCIVTESILSLFRQAGFTGFEAHGVTVEKINRVSRKQREEIAIPSLWELAVNGKGGDAAPESGIYPLYEIRDTGTYSYSSFRNGIIVDETNWDGSDFFTVNGYPKFILVTERVKMLIIARQLTNCALIPSHELEWGSGERPEESLEKARAVASRSLDSLLADLEGPEISTDAIHALGHKGDPRAVDALIRKFAHPDPFVWLRAASAVAAIAQHKETPEHTRNEIFSKVCNLLCHDEPQVRESAATALGYIGGERAASEVMRLLDDPDAYVRGKAVFVMNFLRYKPALEAVRRLTRDRSKRVRESARRALTELSIDFP